MKGKIRIKDYIPIYSILFAIIIVIALHYFEGRTLIWNNDGKRQFLPALIYWGKYLREIFNNLVNNGKLVIPQFDLSIGEGEDILQSLNGCVILDPFYTLSFFVKEDKTWILYDILQIVRMYFIGLVFSLYCIHNNINSKIAILSGAFTYMFCLFGLLNFARHPSFLNVMIFFPLLLMGVDNIIYKNKGIMLTICVFFASISYFYMFFQMTVLVAIYSIVKLFYLYKNNLKIFFKIIFQILKYSLLGIFIASFIIIPIIYIYITSPRLGINFGIDALYPVLYYLKLPSMFLGLEEMYWVCIGVTSFSFISLVFLYIDKNNTTEKIFTLILFIILLIPFLGHIVNAFSYVTNRWIFVLDFMLAYIIALKWDKILQLNFKEFIKLTIIIIIISFVSLITRETRIKPTIISLVIMIICLMVVGINVKFRNIKIIAEIALFVILIVNIVLKIHLFYFSYRDYASQMLTYEQVKYINNNEIKVLKEYFIKTNSNDFCRYSGRNISVNYSMLDKIPSTATYWSYPNGNVYEYRRKLELPQSLVNAFYDYDDREISMALDSVKYFTTNKNDKGIVPNGFSEIIESRINNNKYNFFKTDNYLPVVYQYEKTIRKSEWEKLNPIDKEEVMMEAIVIDNIDTFDSLSNYNSKTVNLNYKFINKSDDTILNDNCVYTFKDKEKLVLEYDSEDNNDMYFRIKGLHFKGMTDWDYYNQSILELNKTKYSKKNYENLDDNIKKNLFDTKLHYVEPTELRFQMNHNSVNKVIRSFTKYAPIQYSDWTDFTVYIGKSSKGKNQVSITFPSMGIYNYDSIEIIKKEKTNLLEKYDDLKIKNLEAINFDVDKISTNIDLNDKKWICFSIPYSKGWTAYIDGNKTKIHKANIKHMAVFCNSGKHDIVLIYERPGQIVGYVLSIIGVLLFIFTFAINRKRSLEQNE